MTVHFYRYPIPSTDGLSGWGCFVLGSDGFFAAVTDYGNYAHRFDLRTHADDSQRSMFDIRAFIVHCHGEYIRRKVAPGRIFDVEGTVANFRRRLLELRRGRAINSTQAACHWQELSQLGDEFDWIRWMDNTDFPDAWDVEPASMVPVQVQAFEQRLLPRLQQAIREDLAREAATIPGTEAP